MVRLCGWCEGGECGLVGVEYRWECVGNWEGVGGGGDAGGRLAPFGLSRTAWCA